jgi:hypothetical protein
MTWVLVLAIAAVVIIMVMNGRNGVPWSGRMRRVPAGVARTSEWMAPDEVVEQVRADYLTALRWMHDHMLSASHYQLANAPTYLNGAYLKRYQAIVTQNRAIGAPRGVGILRADHQVFVRQFSEDGEHCLVIDQQEQRRMATYDPRSHERVHTQDLGDGAVVYSMHYDLIDRRWKIDEFVQELPPGWGGHIPSRRIRELATLPTSIGRDN